MGTMPEVNLGGGGGFLKKTCITFFSMWVKDTTVNSEEADDHTRSKRTQNGMCERVRLLEVSPVYEVF